MDYSDVPEGYAPLKEIEGETWEERKRIYEEWTGRTLKTIKEMEKEPPFDCPSCEERQHDESL